MGKRGRNFPVLICLTLLLACACGPSTANGAYSATIVPGLQPRLAPDDAVRITRQYLDAQMPQLAAPEIHIPAHVDSAVAIDAADARSLDGCIPIETSSDIVWVTKGTGDYLNLSSHPWSPRGSKQTASDPVASQCLDPGPSGTLVIDDSTGQILGVFPARPGIRGQRRNRNRASSQSPGLPEKTSLWSTLVEAIRLNDPGSVPVPALLTRSHCSCVHALRATARQLRQRTSRAPCRRSRVMKSQKQDKRARAH